MRKKKRPRIDRDLYISNRDKEKGYTYEDMYNSKISINDLKNKK